MRLGCESCGQPHSCICNQFATCSVCDCEFLPDGPTYRNAWVCPECEADEDE